MDQHRFKAQISNYTRQDDVVTYFVVIKDNARNQVSSHKYRYSEMKALHKQIQEKIDNYKLIVDIPNFPEKKFFGKTNNSDQSISQRSLQLEQYLNEMLQQEKLWSLQLMKDSLLPPKNQAEDEFLETFFRDAKKEGSFFSNSSTHSSVIFDPPKEGGDVLRVVIDNFTQDDDTIRYYVRFYDMVNRLAYETKYRYNEIRALNDNLVNNFKYLPKFPGKKLFSITNENQESIRQRSVEMAKYLNFIFQKPEIMQQECVRYFIEDSQLHQQFLCWENREAKFKKILMKLKIKREEAIQLIREHGFQDYQQFKFLVESKKMMALNNNNNSNNQNQNLEESKCLQITRQDSLNKKASSLQNFLPTIREEKQVIDDNNLFDSQSTSCQTKFNLESQQQLQQNNQKEKQDSSSQNSDKYE